MCIHYSTFGVSSVISRNILTCNMYMCTHYSTFSVLSAISNTVLIFCVQDFVIDVEHQSTVFDVMYQYGQQVVARYPPSEKLQETLSSLLNEWVGFVGEMNNRWNHILAVQVCYIVCHVTLM